MFSLCSFLIFIVLGLKTMIKILYGNKVFLVFELLSDLILVLKFEVIKTVFEGISFVKYYTFCFYVVTSIKTVSCMFEYIFTEVKIKFTIINIFILAVVHLKLPKF